MRRKKEILKNLNKKKIVVLKGGWSSERKVSLKTGENIENALKSLGLRVVGLDLKKDFFEKLKRIKPDICFIALHGSPGEDGVLQGALELLKIPYTGSGVLASALSFNKVFSKIIFEKFGILTPKWISITRDSFHSGIISKRIPFKFPVVVKPVSQGSTIGISIVQNQKGLKDAIILAFKYDRQVLVEEYIKGREITVSILEDKSLPVIEIIPVKSSFYDYKAKYQKGGSEHIIPAKISKKIYSQCQKIGISVHKALGCESFSRVDMRLRKNGEIFVLEINTIPGMTSMSLLPDAAKFAGIDFQEMISRILNYTLKKYKALH